MTRFPQKAPWKVHTPSAQPPRILCNISVLDVFNSYCDQCLDLVTHCVGSPCSIVFNCGLRLSSRNSSHTLNYHDGLKSHTSKTSQESLLKFKSTCTQSRVFVLALISTRTVTRQWIPTMCQIISEAKQSLIRLVNPPSPRHPPHSPLLTYYCVGLG